MISHFLFRYGYHDRLPACTHSSPGRFLGQFVKPSFTGLIVSFRAIQLPAAKLYYIPDRVFMQ